MQDEEFIQSFVEESKVHVETVENELLNLNIQAIDMESINTIFRAVHSVKGSSGFFDFKQIVALSHALENIYGEIRAGKMGMNNEMVDVLLSANDCLRVMIDDVMNSENVDILPFTSKLAQFPLGLDKTQAVPVSANDVATTKTKKKSGKKKSVTIPDENAEHLVTSTLKPDENTFLMNGKQTTVAMKEHIRGEIDRGCNLFRLTRKLYGDLLDHQVHVGQLLQEVAAMGSLIDCRIEIEPIADFENVQVDATIVALFTTVLQKDFLPPLLTEPETGLVEMVIKDDAEKSMPDDEFFSDGDINSDDENFSDKETHSDDADIDTEREKAPNVSVQPASMLAETFSPEPVQGQQEKDKHKTPAVSAEDSIRVNVSLLNNLLNLSSEMVLARNQLFRTMEHHKKDIPGLEPIFQNINHITTNLQEKIMQTRMQPVSIVFNKFPRIARELAKKLEKDILLELEGTEVELDKSIIESLGDPLTHLVRNAVDHGLESSENRLKAGKPRTGTINLKAYHESGYVNIDVVDDGKGINTEIIRKKAYDKGFIQKGDVTSMGEQESLQLLFRPGFSTAEAITDVSGRGVGMDVVKTNIEKLGGKIEIFTELGKGTTFRLLLPLTLAIIPSLIVEVEDQKFALPQINVQEIVRIKASDPTRKIEYINNAEVLRLRGKLLPIVRLADVLGLERTYYAPEAGKRVQERRKLLVDIRRTSEPVTSESTGASGTKDRRGYSLTNIVRILVIKIGSRRLGLSVDVIHGSEEILVKTLPIHVKECKNYSGVTILGDGKAAMILDPGGIIENANLRYIDGQVDGKNKQAVTESEKMREHQSLLLFRCSGPETLAMDMSMVSRVDEIKIEDIETIGDEEYIQFRGESMRIIRPEDFLPIKKAPLQNLINKKIYVIIPKLMKQPMGILIETLQDTIQTRVHMTNKEGKSTKGFVGSAIIQDKIVMLLNVYELFELVNPELYQVAVKTHNGRMSKVLLVEDTPFFQRLEMDYLEKAGYEVILAENGIEALKVLQNEKFDAVVSDINMPEMNGLELVKRIRADAQLARLPVIAVTSLTGELQKKEGMAAGFDSYEFKLDRAVLLDVLEQTIQKKRVLA